MRLVQVAIIVALPACNYWFGAEHVGAPVDAPPDVPPDVPAPLESGCTDGTREGFHDEQRYPLIAACQGKWNVVGLSSSRTGHTCETLADIMPCAAADLCAAGWEICTDQHHVAAAGATTCDLNAVSGFYVTLQRSQAAAVCDGVPGGANDLFGCQAPSATEAGDAMTCPPLNATSGDGCKEITGLGFVCASGASELNTVQKTTIVGGGVLCCKI